MRRFATVLAFVVLAASGGYVIVYLFRWEWHRALIAGLFFLATEIALVGMALLRRLRALERRLAAAPPAPTGHDEVVLGVLRQSAPPPQPRFAWLSADPGRLGVFLPVLLGAGALASAVAWAVEWAARVTARPVLERSLAVRLSPLSLPSQGLLGPVDRAPVVRRPPRPGRWMVWAVGVPAVAFTSAMGIDTLSDATQTRADTTRPGWATTLDMRMYGAGDPEAAGDHLWAACRHLLGHRAAGSRIEHPGDGRTRIGLPFDLGAHAADRLHGCLEDAVVDHVQAKVLGIDAGPRARLVRPAGAPTDGGGRPAPG